MSDKKIVGALFACSTNFTQSVDGYSYEKIPGKPRPDLRGLHSLRREMNAVCACSQRNIRSSVYKDFASRGSSKRHGMASQFIQGAVGQVFFPYLYKVDAPMKRSPDARIKGNAG